MRRSGNSMPMTPRNLPGRFNNTMQYFYTNEKGQKEEVALEAWMWGVIYKDGSEMLQFDPAGIFHRIGEIKAGRGENLCFDL